MSVFSMSVYLCVIRVLAMGHKTVCMCVCAGKTEREKREGRW